MKSIWKIDQTKYDFSSFSSLEEYFSKTLSKDDIVAVGVSGGPDSMFLSCALYDFFERHHYNIQNLVFIHLHHGVRKESDQELLDMKQRFEGKNLVIFSRDPSQKSTENELRKRRYSKFLEAMTQFAAKKIFLGHHFDDRVETSLLNMLRGAGIDGLMSIKPKESHYLLDGNLVCRPLIFLRKKQIIRVLNKEKIPYVEDNTNKKSGISQRNYIRNEILPALFSQKGFEDLFRKWYQEYDILDKEQLLSPITMSPYWNAKSAYRLEKIRTLCTGQDLLRIFKQLHASSGVTRKTLEEFLKFLHTSEKGRKEINGIIVMISHQKVYFFDASPLFWEKYLDNSKEIATLNQKERFPQQNYIYRGKTRNKYCICQKIPIFWRNFIPVIVKDNIIKSWDKKSRENQTIF